MSPFYFDKRTCLSARLRLLWLVIRLPRCLRFVSCLSDPKPSITACYSGNFRLSFQHLSGCLAASGVILSGRELLKVR
ncbi:MAG: hypothetical protein WCK18_02780 [Prolixibacteraceae bacterium]